MTILKEKITQEKKVLNSPRIDDNKDETILNLYVSLFLLPKVSFLLHPPLSPLCVLYMINNKFIHTLEIFYLCVFTVYCIFQVDSRMRRILNTIILIKVATLPTLQI